MPSDVFGLDVVYDRQVDSNWPESSNYGYFAGGNAPGNVCTIDRLDFFNETVTEPSSNLTQARSSLGSVFSSNYGYFVGGTAPPYVCTIDRLDFSNEVVAVPPVNGQLPSARYQFGTTYNSDYGYFGGGWVSAGNYTSTIDRIDFSNETTSLPNSNLSMIREVLSGSSNSNYGYSYFAGGYGGPPPVNIRSTIDRLDFSSETTSLPGNNLPQAKGWMAPQPVSGSDYGYLAGGCTIPVFTGPAYYCIVNRLDFSTETLSLPGKNLSIKRRRLSGTFNSNYGYFAGGDISTPPAPTVYSTIDRIDFSNETVSAPGNNLTQARTASAAVSGGKSINAKGVKKGTDVNGVPISSTYGYFGGGSKPPSVSYLQRISFSDETVSPTASPPLRLTQARSDLAAVSNSNYGYFGGGSSTCTIDRLDFSNETVSEPSSELTQARNGLAAVSNSNYGYFAGGQAPPSVCTIDRLDFSNETVSEPSSNLSEARRGLVGVSNFNYGYFAGGFVPPYVCTIDRIDFSNETTSVPSSNLTQARTDLAAVSNSNYGYFGGGQAPPSVCTIDRIDFSNETVTAPSSNLTQARTSLAAVSNSNYGYFGGGFSPPTVKTIDRLEFSNETTSAPGSDLSQQMQGGAGVSN